MHKAGISKIFHVIIMVEYIDLKIIITPEVSYEMASIFNTEGCENIQ